MKKIKTYAFWVALSGSIVILVESVAKLFGFSIDSSTIENVIMAICGVLVVLGIVTKDSKSSKQSMDNKDVIKNVDNKTTISEDNKSVTIAEDTEVAKIIDDESITDEVDVKIDSIEVNEFFTENNKSAENDFQDVLYCDVIEDNNLMDNIDGCNKDVGGVTIDDASIKEQIVNDVVLKILTLFGNNPDCLSNIEKVEMNCANETIKMDNFQDVEKVQIIESECPNCSEHFENGYINDENCDCDDINCFTSHKNCDTEEEVRADEVDGTNNVQGDNEVQKAVRHCVDIRRS